MPVRDAQRHVPALTNDDPPGKASDLPSPQTVSSSNAANTAPGGSWVAGYPRLAHDIQVRPYSPKPLKAYTQWVRHLQTWTRSKEAASLSSTEVREFLTSLAVDRKVSASTQNPAFNARLFFYSYGLTKEFGKVEGVVRAKRKPYVPVVFSREEMATILRHLPPPYALVVKLLYGGGLRLAECLPLRVQWLNCDAGIFPIHDGKGGKDRTVPLPETILPELRAQLESLKGLHQRDLERDYAGVFLVNA
jgi:integrase